MKFEYKVVKSKREPSARATKQLFDEWGYEGWELVAVVPLANDRREAIFKRESTATEPPPPYVHSKKVTSGVVDELELEGE